MASEASASYLGCRIVFGYCSLELTTHVEICNAFNCDHTTQFEASCPYQLISMQ
jgi:hypothetical protein